MKDLLSCPFEKDIDLSSMLLSLMSIKLSSAQGVFGEQSMSQVFRLPWNIVTTKTLERPFSPVVFHSWVVCSISFKVFSHPTLTSVFPSTKIITVDGLLEWKLVVGFGNLPNMKAVFYLGSGWTPCQPCEYSSHPRFIFMRGSG